MILTGVGGVWIVQTSRNAASIAVAFLSNLVEIPVKDEPFFIDSWSLAALQKCSDSINDSCGGSRSGLPPQRRQLRE